MSRPLRIALLMHSLRPRGGVVHALELAHALAERGHAVSLIASAEPGERLFRTIEVPLHRVALPELSGDLLAQAGLRIDALVRGLPPILAAGAFDLLHAQDSLSGHALATLRSEVRGPTLPPWLRTVHHLDVFADPTLAAWQERAWRAADAVACVSDQWVTHFREVLGVPARRMFNGVNLARYRPRPAAGEDRALDAIGLPAGTGPVCLLVGGVEKRKNTTRLLHAFARLRRGDPAWCDARLVVAGGASMLDHAAARLEWQQALAAHGLAEGSGQAVVRTGPVADEVLAALMRRADVLAMPSLMEGFGLAALEALACGTPVLVSDRAPFTEHFEGTDAVAWCDPEDIASLVAGLRHAVCLPRPTETPLVCLRHSWARSAALHEDWYLQCLATRAAARASPEIRNRNTGARDARDALHDPMA